MKTINKDIILDIHEALVTGLIFTEDAKDSEVFKPGTVNAAIRKIRKAIGQVDELLAS